MDRIVVYSKDNERISEVLTSNKEEISHEVLADDIVTGDADGYIKEWSINGETVTLGVKKQ
jgi:isoleucyl-tRNA synthetase